jgi:hypothetical protein
MQNWQLKLRKLLLFAVLLLLFIPLIQNKFEVIKLKPLNGAIVAPQKTYIKVKDWLSGDYQKNTEKYLNETFGFRNTFIRLNNQIAFNLFKKAKANGVIIGKENYLYEENYIKAYTGTDFIGEDSIADRMLKIKFIQDTLKSMNKSIFLVFAAGKASFYPEYIPDKYLLKKGPTNYDTYLKYARKLKINHIDFNKYFVDHKHNSKYLLYPTYGIHWSYYGMSIAADSIIHYVEKLRNTEMNHMECKGYTMDQAKATDYDIGDGMNLLFKLDGPMMAYPELHFGDDSLKSKPSFLVISDSFYWEMYNYGISSAFSNSNFWYYNKQIYPDSFEKEKLASQIDLKEEIKNHDVIMIMATEATLPKLGWDFVENVYKLYHP